MRSFYTGRRVWGHYHDSEGWGGVIFTLTEISIDLILPSILLTNVHNVLILNRFDYLAG